MELEMATTADIINELRKRNLRFVFVGVENTNTDRDDAGFIAGYGFSVQDVLHLINIGQETFRELDEGWNDFGSME